MKPSSLFGIDKRAVGMIMMICAIACIVLAWRIKTEEPCKPFLLKFTSADFYEGSVILFSAANASGKRFEWDFGDNENIVTGTGFDSHVYRHAGQYRVFLTVNNQCEQSVVVDIIRRPPQGQLSSSCALIYPQTVIVNKDFNCWDSTSSNGPAQWFMDETGNINGTGQKITWNFRSTGLKTIYLRHNGQANNICMGTIRVIDPAAEKPVLKQKQVELPDWDKLLHLKDKPDDTIQHKDIPVPATEPKSVVSALNTADLPALLEEVVIGNKTSNDFSGYFCGKTDVNVIYNNAVISFNEMCNRLREIKKLNKINKPLVVVTKDQDGCVKSLNVSVTKRSIWDKIMHPK